MEWNSFGWNEGGWNDSNDAAVLGISSFTVIAETGFNKAIVTAGGSRVEIWRQYAGGEARALTRTLPVGADVTFYDGNAISGISAQYWAVAVDSLGAQVTSATVSATQSFGGAYLHKVVRADSTTIGDALMLLNNQEGARRQISVANNIIHLPAFDKPIIEISTTVERRWLIPNIIPDLTDGTRQTLNGYIRNHSVLCCRDERGRLMFGVMQKVKEKLDTYGDYPFELIETDFREHVKAA
jgi:hypothetical protein